MKRIINQLLKQLGYHLMSQKSLSISCERKFENRELKRRLDLMERLEDNKSLLDPNIEINIHNLISRGSIYSQNFQDIKAAILCNFKKAGFYVEFGADDGIKNSNTFYLKQALSWKGILIEPNPIVFDDLILNRDGDVLSDDLIFHTSGLMVRFLLSGQLSTIEEFVNMDFNGRARLEKVQNFVIKKTITLSDLLEKYNAPFEIDFISVDTEGSEFEILKSFNFEKYNAKLFCVEHNNNSTLKEKLRILFAENNFEEVVFNDEDLDSFFLKKN